jgi:HAD superfamily hydrolase (TIGR01458 family)
VFVAGKRKKSATQRDAVRATIACMDGGGPQPDRVGVDAARPDRSDAATRGILFDIDGVFFVGDTAVPGGADVITWADAAGIPYLFVTNTTSHPRSYLADKLARFGVDADPARILTPAVAAHEWLTEHARTPVALFVPDATAAEFGDLPRVAPDAESGAAAVVVGDLGQAWDFATMNRAFRLLTAEPPPTLVALGMARFWKDDDGLTLDNGPFAQALAYASGADPVVTGKPAADFFHAAAHRLGLAAPVLVMVGDDVRGDVGGAQGAGMRGVLVKTGKFHPTDLERGITPDAALDSVADLSAWWDTDSNTRWT